MGNFSKKAVAAGVSIATAAWLSGAALFVPVAGAQTTADLQAQITALLAQISALQAKLGTSAPASSAYNFTRSLTVGSSGADVKALQQYLNNLSGTTYDVALSGPGSPGNESTYFGAKTKAAVAKWQAAVGISPASGYFGPISRAKYSSTVATTATTTATTGATSTTATSTAATSTNTGVEGSLTVKLASLPADLTEVKEGQSDVAVVAFEVKAKNNSVTLGRVDLNFNKRPWLSWNDVSLWDGSTLLQRVSGIKSSDFDEVTAGSDYRLRFSGFSVNVDKDVTKVLTVKVSAPTKTESGSVNINITANANSFRGTDPVGKTQDAPNAALTARTAKFLAKDTGDLELSLSTDNPKQKNVQVSDTGTSEVELLRVKLKARNQDVQLKTLNVGTLTTTENMASTTDTLKLYVDGVSASLAAATPDAITGTSTFINLTDKADLKVLKDTTKTLIIKATVKKLVATNYGQGAMLSSTINANAADIVAEDANFATATISGSNVVGNRQHLYTKAPVMTLLSGTATAASVSSSNIIVRGNGKIRVAVTAFGSDIFVYTQSSTNQASSGFDATSTVVGITPTTTFTSVADSAATGGTAAESKTFTWRVGQGETKVFEVTVTFQSGVGAGAGNFNAYIKRFLWTTSDQLMAGSAGVAAAPFLQDWSTMSTDFKTNDVFLQGS